jgi:soluble lytic murein transglycosylase-like protein
MKLLDYIQKNWILMSICLSIGAVTTYLTVSVPKKHDLEIHKNIDKDLPPSLRVYYYINYYSDSLEIPINYLYGIANTESSWQGPFDFKYKPNVKSPVGALGPMQIMPATAKSICGKSISKKVLQNDIQLNVRISALLVKKLYDKYGDWEEVFGAYNTGKPIINKYAKKVSNYEPDWTDSVIVNLNK